MRGRPGKKIPESVLSRIRKTVPMLTVDGVILLDNKVLLLKRDIPPYRGYWVLPGGHVRLGETVEEAVIREIKEETGLDAKIDRMVGVYSNPGRDPRGQLVSVAYLIKTLGGELRPGKEEASDARFFRVLPKKIGFDHRKIIADARRKARIL